MGLSLLAKLALSSKLKGEGGEDGNKGLLKNLKYGRGALTKLNKELAPTVDKISQVSGITGTALSTLGAQPGQDPNFGMTVGGGALQGLSMGRQFGLPGMIGGALFGGVMGLSKAAQAKEVFDSAQLNYSKDLIDQKTVQPMASFEGGGTVIGDRMEVPRTDVGDFLIREAGIPEQALNNLVWFVVDHETGGTRKVDQEEGNEGGGVGLFQFQPKSVPTLINRLETFYKQNGQELPDTYKELRSGDKVLQELTVDEQINLGLAELIKKRKAGETGFKVVPDKKAFKDRNYEDPETYASIWFDHINKSGVEERRNQFAERLSGLPEEVFKIPNLVAQNPLPEQVDPLLMMALGGEVPALPLQAEVGETVLMPDGSLTTVKADEKHSKMDDSEVTDILPEGSFIFSDDKDMRIKLSELGDEVVQQSTSYYEKGNLNNSGQLLFSDFIKGKGGTPAEISTKISKKIPVFFEDGMDMMARITSEENKETQLPLLAVLAQAQEGMKEPEGTPATQFNTGGAIDFGMLSEMLGQIGTNQNQSRDADLERYKKLANQQIGLAGLAFLNNTLTTAAQDPTVRAPQVENTFLAEAFRGAPLSLIDQQASTLARQPANIARNVIDAGVNPGQAVNVVAPILSQSLDAESQFRSQQLRDRLALRRGYFSARNENLNRNNQLRTQADNATRANQNQMLAQIGSAGQGLLNNVSQTIQDRTANISGVESGYSTNMNALDQARMDLELLRQRLGLSTSTTQQSTSPNFGPPLLIGNDPANLNVG